MSAEERETLSLGLARGHSLRAMAAVLRRAPSTVSCEHARNAMRAFGLKHIARASLAKSGAIATRDRFAG
jgi:IS30 family transposase